MIEQRENAYRGCRAMVTGGLGFIGSNLARSLVHLEAQVTIVDSLVPGCGANRWNIHDIQSQVDLQEVDLQDSEAMSRLVRGQDCIFNLAGQVSHIDSMTKPLEDLEINCRSHLSLLEVCRRENPTARIIYAGTRQQYGRPLRLPVDENHPNNPMDVNGINKMAAEWYHRLYHEVYGLQTCSLRLTNTFGPGILIKHSRQGFISVFIRRVLDDETIQVFGDGSQLRDFNYVSDVVSAFLMAGDGRELGGETYNLGSTEVLSVLQIAEMMVRIGGRGRIEVVPFPDERKRIDIGSYYGNFEKIRKEFGWEPKVSVEEGIRHTLTFFQKYGEHYL